MTFERTKMSAAVQELNLIIDGMDDSLVRVLINVARNFSHPKIYNAPSQKKPLRIGLLKGKKLMADGVDFDMLNEEIAKEMGA